jgi:hypothetical protein
VITLLNKNVKIPFFLTGLLDLKYDLKAPIFVTVEVRFSKADFSVSVEDESSSGFHCPFCSFESPSQLGMGEHVIENHEQVQ